ncbi:hypothetical protein C0993_010810 [Termitomyces sp. T159_Od127]|nr:hypothetical protein C0993_010810 [Termitomyces sp. T159_Od127]
MAGLSSLLAKSLTLYLLLLLPHVRSDPAVARFTECFDDDSNVTQRLQISTVFAQALENDSLGKFLNLTLLGRSPQPILGFTNTSGSLATLFTSTNVLTLNAWTNSSYFCSTLRPPSPLPVVNSTDGTYCPIPSGEFAFSTSIPWGDHRALTTLSTRLRAVDPSLQEVLCVDVITTPLDPQPDSPYGQAKIIFWCTVALAIAYWIVVGLARIVSAWGRGITRHDGLWSRAQSAGFILASAISGERFATSPALMRFCTPSMRDVMFHTQWCAVLAMVAVEWPPFVYPILTQTAWSTLSYNITLLSSAASHHWNPFHTPPYPPSSNFTDQLNDSGSPLFINASVANTLFTLPDDATHGLSSFAYTIGLRPQDLFSVCLILFLSILAGAILLAIFVWFIDYLACSIANTLGGPGNSGPHTVTRLTGARSPGFSSIKDSPDTANSGAQDEGKSLNGQSPTGHGLFKPPSRFALPLSTGGSSTDRGINRVWWRFRSDFGSFHSSVLHGNLVRILLLFHLPVTIFSVYQMVMPRDLASMSSKALAGLSFALFSVLIPAHLVIRVTLTTTSKLYDETRTLLSLGPLYNHYRHGSQLFAGLFFATNLAFGITIGAGQKSGTAQAIIILVIEIVSALVTSIWLPWGTGASMGLISFLFCVARIVIAVLLLILSPTISIGAGAGSWVAYGILIILALVFLALLLMLLVKLVEALVRIFGQVGFDRSRHVVDSGLLGACGLLGCCGSRQRHNKHRPRDRRNPYKIADLRPQQQPRDSDVSSYIPPTFPSAVGEASTPRFLGVESRRGSSSLGPPSVLRPEQAMRPYREDSEDEGYIMGAWKPYPRTGYTPVLNDTPVGTTKSNFKQQLTKSSQTTLGTAAPSGFSRIGGGRAHIDAPYAIATGSTHTFPSIGHSTMHPHTLFDDDESPPPSLSNVEGRQTDFSILPPGAAQPSHIRTKSQTAIVEDADILAALQASASSPGRTQQHETSAGALLRPPVMTGLPHDNDDEDSEELVTKKKSWFRLGRSRVYSSEDPPSAGASSLALPSLPVAEELGGVGSTPQPTRSFVVIRKAQPGSAGSRSANAVS